MYQIDLGKKAVLVTLQISSFSGRQKDDSESKDVMERNGSKPGTALVMKTIIGKEFLKPIQKIAGEMRTFDRKMTQPWTSSGSKILPSKLFQKYSTRNRELKGMWEKAVQDLIDNLPEAIRQAQNDLGKMFHASDYPTGDELREKFSWEVNFDQVPINDFRCSLSDAEISELNSQAIKREKDHVEKITRDLFTKVRSSLENISKKLGDYKPVKNGKNENVFRDSLIGNVRELADTLPAFNLGDDPLLDDLAKDLKNKIANLNPTTLRESSLERGRAIKSADDTIKKMAGYFGTEEN